MWPIDWVSENMYCLVCISQIVEHHPKWIYHPHSTLPPPPTINPHWTLHPCSLISHHAPSPIHGRPQEFSQGGGASPKKAPLKTKKAPLKTKKAPPPKKKNEIVLSPFLGGSEACSPEKILTMVLPTTF